MRVLVGGVLFAWIVVPEVALAQPPETTDEGTTEAVALQLDLGVDESALGMKIAFTESFGIEASVSLMPDERASVGLVAIVTQTVESFALHANAGVSRDGEAAVVASIAVEGPAHWIVRPVLELGSETSAGEAMSPFGTIGALIDVSDAVAIDAAAHVTRDGMEARLGVTAVVAP